MGHEKQEQWESDEERFGPVDNVHDLEPETGVGPHIAAHQQKEMLSSDDAMGYFEREGGSPGGLGRPLHLDGDIVKDGAPAVATYQAGYNTYADPLRLTLAAEGRVKDLSEANAPLTPADLEKDPKLAAHFKNLSIMGPQDHAMSSWSGAQDNLTSSIKRFGGGQHVLAGAIANYTRVQKNLEAKRKELERQSKLHEIAKVDETVKTLHEIITTTTEAWTFAGELDEIIGTTAFDETREEEVVEGSTDPKPNWEHGTADDPTGENTQLANKGQKVAGGIDRLTTDTAQARQIIADAKAKMGAAGEFDLSIDGVLTAIVGGKDYVKLKQDVVTLEANIRELGLEADAADVHSATESLSGFKMTFSADRQQMLNNRTAARNFARDFAGASGVNAGDRGAMAMYAAEAYQELARFGELANQTRKDLEPAWGQAHYYMRTTNIERFRLNNMMSDARELALNLKGTMEQRDYFAKNLPKWQKNAQDWNNFFTTNAHHTLDHEHEQKPRR